MSLRVAQQQMGGERAARKRLHQVRDRQAQRGAGALDHRAAGRRAATHEEGDAHDAVVADHRDLRQCPALHDVEQRYECGPGEIRVTPRDTVLAQRLSERQPHWVHDGSPALHGLPRQGRHQEVVLEQFLGLTRNTYGRHDSLRRCAFGSR